MRHVFRLLVVVLAFVLTQWAKGDETMGVAEMPELITEDIAVTRTFNATPERVWRAWT